MVGENGYQIRTRGGAPQWHNACPVPHEKPHYARSGEEARGPLGVHMNAHARQRKPLHVLFGGGASLPLPSSETKVLLTRIRCL